MILKLHFNSISFFFQILVMNTIKYFIKKTIKLEINLEKQYFKIKIY